MEPCDDVKRIMNAKRDFLNYKVVYYCSVCGKKIPTFWLNDWTLDGNFLADDAWYSETLTIMVNNPTGIVCWSCAGPRKFLL